MGWSLADTFYLRQNAIHLKRLKWSTSRLIFFNVFLALDMILWHEANNHETGIPRSAETTASV